MTQISVGGWIFDLGVCVIDDRRWWTCPIGGEGCGKVLADLGPSAIDCMAWHVEHTHLPTLLQRLSL
ncbi:hypothetical protein [Saccharopolyspora flava]|uniref:hypothetical protein n=1 Tax=Saccharopolyspora flava TaxID=95161 RepID=UPI000B829F9C|nr:hypothetical protein [Saccharopolyspora flava]